MLIQDYESWLYVQCSLTELLKAFLVKTQHNAFEELKIEVQIYYEIRLYHS